MTPRLPAELDHGVRLLGGRPDAPALVTADGTVTYADLADAVERTRELLGAERRLVLLEAASDVASVTTYLAALTGGHPVLLVGPGEAERHAELVARYDPDVVQTVGSEPRELRPGTAHDLHPELALLLSTSGSTGSPKLVRLSRTNVLANARSIADYLGIRVTDRAMTSLPLHYCYGLSVLNSHLVAGAAVVLTDLSVADECFWELATRTEASSFAGVPYTFDLLDASGFAERDLPRLRYITQAGGRMDPAHVVQYAELGRRRGWDLYVMYGQTEATARMAYLPPDRAATRPSAIGVPVPGGALRLEPVPDVDEPGVGELVYTGPNVMMGYALDAADLASGPVLTELRTGDLARRGADGLWEVVGRLNRHAKVFGLRLDLDRLEQRLLEHGLRARIVVHDDRLRVFVDKPRTSDRVRRLTASLATVPVGAVRVDLLEAFPTTASGKTDYTELARHAALVDALPEPGPEAAPGAEVTADSVRDMLAVLLGRPDATHTDSFVSLGGDSLSFVEASMRLGRHLGHLPAGWQRLDAETLASAARPPRRRLVVPVETSVLLRALAILLVVVTHTDLVLMPGGAHVLLAVAGFNLARFTLDVPGRRVRTRRILGAVARFALPAMGWIALVGVVLGSYRPATALFLNGMLGADTWDNDWQPWFLEVLVWTYAGVAGLLAVPALDRWQRARPFGVAMVAVAATLLLRFAWTGVEAGPTERYTLGVVLWCLALGWAAAAAHTRGHRLLVSALTVSGCVGFFGDPARESVVATGILLLVWVRTVPVPRPLDAGVTLVAGASLWIYLTHWQVYPDLEAAGHPVVAVLASVAVGVAVATAYGRAGITVGRCVRRMRAVQSAT